MNSVIFYHPPTSTEGHRGRSIASRNLLPSALDHRFSSTSARNRSGGDATRLLGQRVVISHKDSPRLIKDRPLISATSQNLGGLDMLADSGDELSLLTDLLSRARPVTSRVVPQMIDLTIDLFNDPADSHNDNATSVILTEGQEAPRFDPQDNEPDVSYADMDGIVALSSQNKALMRDVRDISNAAIARSPTPEIADSINGRTVHEETDKLPRPFVFDVFAEDVDGLVDGDQPPAKRRRRAPSPLSSVHPG